MEIKRMKIDTKDKSPLDVPHFPKRGLNVQFQSSPKRLQLLIWPSRIEKLEWRKWKCTLFQGKYTTNCPARTCRSCLRFSYNPCLTNSLPLLAVYHSQNGYQKARPASKDIIYTPSAEPLAKLLSKLLKANLVIGCNLGQSRIHFHDSQSQRAIRIPYGFA